MFGLIRKKPENLTTVEFFHKELGLERQNPKLLVKIATHDKLIEGKPSISIDQVINDLISAPEKMGGIIINTVYDSNIEKTVSHSSLLNPIQVGLNGISINVLQGLSPELAANSLKKTFSNRQNTSERFWVNAAIEFIKNSLGILQFVPELYTLQGVYEFLFDESRRHEYTNQAIANISSCDLRTAEYFDAYNGYFNNSYTKFIADRTLLDTLVTCSEVLSPFQTPDLLNAFANKSESENVIQEICEGKVLTFNIPQEQWGNASTSVCNLLNTQFEKIVYSRTTPPLFLLVIK